MPLHLILSTSTNRLIDDLAASLALPGPAEALRPVLLPSRPLVERVRLALAKKAGVAMGVEFVLPATFLNRLAEALGLPELDAAWTPEGLFWRLLPLVEAKAGEPRLRAACADPRARLALARQVADRFDQYLHFRPQLIEAWDAGKPWSELPLEAREDEAWQRDLWQGLKASAVGKPHPAQRLRELREAARRAEPGLLGPGVEVLTTGPLPKSLLEVLAAFGESDNEVRLRCLLPSVHALVDIDTKRALRQRGEDPQGQDRVHDLLAQLGRQSIETFQALNSLEESGQAFEPLEDEPEAAEPSLLQALQADIRAARLPDPVAVGLSETPETLRSLRVHRCHGARREVEVLRDELLEAFSRDPDLRPEDVLILVPDLETYGPLAEALLPRTQPPLPLRLAERRLESQDAAFEALKALMHFAAGRAPLSAGLALLELPAIAAKLGEEAQAALLERLEASGITFGLDAAHRSRWGAGGEASGTWGAGLDRLLAGLWLGEAPEAVDPQAAPLLPVAGALSSGRQGLAGGLDYLDLLVKTALAWQEPASPAVWSQRLQAARRELLGTVPEAEDEAVAGLLAQLEQAQTSHGCTLALDAARLLDWLDWLGLDESRSVKPVGGHIGLGGFKPLRALPCKVLAVLGLFDAAFPRRSEGLAWDLMAARRQSGDRDPRLEDRQLFLDAILAAERQVILTAPAKSLRTDKDEPFSSCVDELLRACLDTVPQDQRAAWSWALLRTHSLQPFNAGNFGGAQASFDGANAALAQALQAPRQVRAFSDVVPAEAAAASALDFDQLLKFLKEPAAAWVRGLDLQLPRKAEDPAGQDAEPADLESRLLQWQLRQAALDQALEAGHPHLVARLQADRALPYGRLGESLVAPILEEAAHAAQQLLGACGGGLRAQRFEAVLGGTSLAGMLYLGADGKQVVLVSARKLDKPDLRLQAYAQAALASAAGRPAGLLLLGLDKKALALERRPPVDPAEAKAWLEACLRLWHLAQLEPPCFAPATSEALASALLQAEAKGQRPDEAWALEKAEAKWDGDSQWGGDEGRSPAAELAWRGRDPFGPEHQAQWLRLARELWLPVLAWEKAEAEGGAA